MEFELNEDQAAIVDAVEQLLEQHAGPSRAIELAAKGEYDGELDALLRESGFMDVAQGEDTGPLEAALVVNAVARAAGTAAVAASALVVPGVGADREIPGPVALVASGREGPVRYAAHARSLLILDGDEARTVLLEPGACDSVPSNFGYPMGRPPALAGVGESLGPGAGERLRSWWRVALAVEAVGSMSAALDYTVAYLKQRKQFGHAIGSFQAVQHRLANCAIALEGSRWLTYEAVYQNAPEEGAATAAAYAMQAAGQIFAETHQLSGAIGFTREHDLHVWSMRLQALRLELGGVPGHRRELSESRWGKLG